ncbi:hypothetical protein ILUMI_04027 [Ignelater luminosus]|uniref:PiggyBac transposable element-derived protein domain-containing protein n=1 Tax=Ignelater luminosus TaxID=2038154 RepID=A0A8K0DFH6_IGNLU|nr:hypothetical protein ILUMI_04027 [Ignelater luminosus]
MILNVLSTMSRRSVVDRIATFATPCELFKKCITDEQAYNLYIGSESDSDNYIPTNKKSYDESSPSAFLLFRTTEKLDLASSSFTDYSKEEQDFDSDDSIKADKYSFNVVGRRKKNEDSCDEDYALESSNESDFELSNAEDGTNESGNESGAESNSKKSYVQCTTINLNANKPEIIFYYNATKEGVDAMDEKCSKHTSSRRTQRWSMAIFLRILDIRAINLHILYPLYRDNRSLDKYDFIKALAKRLVTPETERRILNVHLSRALRFSIKRGLGISEKPEHGENTENCLKK